MAVFFLFWKVVMLKIKDVYKSYGKNEVLKGVSFTVNKNEIKGLVGVNGAGKSTLIEIVCGVKALDRGDIFISEIDIKNKKQRNEIKRIIGYMPQTFSLFNDLTVEENLGYLCAIYNLNNNVVEDVIEKCFLGKHRKTLVQNLSGGYRQLLSFAGAIIHSPKLIILDEPSSAMDPLFRKMFWDIIKSYKESGVTILLITHYMEELNNCDSFVCLSNGKAVYDGDISGLKKNEIIDIEKILKKYSSEVQNEE